MGIIKDFLLQLTLSVIPIFIYFTFVLERLKNDKNIKIVMAVLWGISIILCMSFPVGYSNGARLDIRFIPLLLGTLYLGGWPGIFLSSLIVVYRLTYGISLGFYNTVLVLVVALPVILYFQKSYVRSKIDKKIQIAVGLSIYYCMIGLTLFTFLHGFSIANLKVQMIHLVFMVVVTLFCIVLIETIREFHQLRTEVQESERFRLISELTSVFAHEIRNPMQVTRGFLQLLNEPDLPHIKKEYIKVSIEELDRANEIINDFLSLGKPSVQQKGTINVSDQLQRLALIIQSFSPNQHVEIKTEVLENCWVDADPQKFNQSMINILKNAVESMPNGGVVWITCESIDDDFIKITVKDEGIGMTKKQLERLGSPYYSLKEKGTGLGMMVSYQIIRSFKGKINVKSEKGKGTEFIILLPRGLEKEYRVIPTIR